MSGIAPGFVREERGCTEVNLRREFDFSSFVRADFLVNWKLSEFDTQNSADFLVNSEVNLKVFTQIRFCFVRALHARSALSHTSNRLRTIPRLME